MIEQVDESIRALVTQVLRGSDVELSFEAPTKEWASRRNKPTVDLFLYDIREDTSRRQVMYEEQRDSNGRVTERKPPPRRFKLSYLVTAWTKRPEDEHRLLSTVLRCFLRYDALPKEVLVGSLADQPLALPVSIAIPPPEDREVPDMWSAMGGEFKPSLDLVVVAPVDTSRLEAAGPPVLEEPRIALADANGEARSAPARRDRGGRGGGSRRSALEEAPSETVRGGTEKQAGRIVRVHGTAER